MDCSAHLARGDVDPGRGIEGLGAENPAFLHHNGAGVLGFATHAYSVPGVSAYTWWASFLQSFVAPNESWIALLVAVGELAIGIALAFGILTPLAALASLALPFTYSMSGTASVTAFYALFAAGRGDPRRLAHLGLDWRRRDDPPLPATPPGPPNEAPVRPPVAVEPQPRVA